MDSATCAQPTALPSAAASQSPLTRLPTVLVHLVMQLLDIDSLARLACTCSLMRADSLHRSSGRYLRVNLPWLPSIGLDLTPRGDPRVWPQARSLLGRAHLSVSLVLIADGGSSRAQPAHELVPAVLALAAGWSHVSQLDLGGAEQWPPEDAIELLSSPCLHRVTSAIDAGGVWLTEPVLSALCRLPLLSSLALTHRYDNSHPALRLHPSALAHATALRTIHVDRCNLPCFRLAGLICAPQVSRLVLMTDLYSSEESQPADDLLLWLHLCCRPLLSNLRGLHLSFVNLANQSRREMRRFFGAMPQLRYLETDSYDPDGTLRSLMDAGVAALPELRVVRFWHGGIDAIDRDCMSPPLLRRFLRLFPLVRYCLTVAGEDGRQWAHEQFALWDRVCVCSDHGAVDVEGLCSECVESDPEQWTDIIGLPLPDESAESIEEQAELAALIAEHESAPLSPEESLRLIETDYERALAEAGPWKAPE